MCDTTYEADVIVVGGGVAGLYSSWRLLSSSDPPKLILLESQDRLGGRLATADVEVGGQRIRVEEGGMRFLDRHLYLQWLLKHMPEEIVDFGMGGEQNFYFVRGRRVTRKEAEDSNNSIWSEIYDLDDGSKNRSPHDILSLAKNRLIIAQKEHPHDWQPVIPEQWQRLRTDFHWKGLPLNKWGFRPLLRDLGLSNDCIQMLIDTGGFASPFDQHINAGAAFQLMANFPKSPRFKTLVNGYQAVTENLENWILERAGRIDVSRRVTRIEEQGERIAVHVVRPGGREATYLCRHVVVTLPPGPILKVRPSQEVLAATKANQPAGAHALNENKLPLRHEVVEGHGDRTRPVFHRSTPGSSVLL